MSVVRASGIVASSFVAGCLLLAALVAPQAWEPVAEPVAEPPKPVPLATEEAVEAAIGISMRAVEGVEPVAEPERRPPVRLASRPDINVTIVLPPSEAEENTVREMAVRSRAAELRSSPLQAPPSPAASTPARSSPPPPAPPAAESKPSRPLGAAPLPGEAWNDPDSVNWSSVPVSDRAAREPAREPGRGGDRPLGRLREWRTARHQERTEARIASREPKERGSPGDLRWPVPTSVLTGIEAITKATADAGPSSARRAAWARESATLLEAVLATEGPRDERAVAALVGLGESVRIGLSLADEEAEPTTAAATRRLALAVARRVAIWRAASGLFLADRSSNDSPQDLATAEYSTVALLDAMERFEEEAGPADAAIIAASASQLAALELPAAHTVAREVEEHYRAANVRIAVQREFLERLLPEPVESKGAVDEMILGRRVRGTRSVVRSTTVHLHPDPSCVNMELEVKGDIDSRTVTDAGPVSVKSRSLASFTVRKPVRITPGGLELGKAQAAAAARGRNDALETSFDSVPIMRSVVRNIAKSQHAEVAPDATREMLDRIIAKSRQEVDDETAPRFAEIESRIRSTLWDPLVQLGLEPKPLALETSAAAASLRLRLAADDQVSGHTPRPRSPPAAVLSLQLHESSFNNAVGRLGVAGRTLPLEGLVAMIRRKLGLEPRRDDDLPEGVTVRFAAAEPVRVTAENGQVRIRVAIDRLESPRRSWEGIVANVAYRPTVTGLQVFLERDGVVQLSGDNQRGRLEIALRAIFSKVFPKERPLAVLPDRVVANPRMEGLSVIEAAVSDGWFAVSLGPAPPVKQAIPATAGGLRRRRF